MDFQEVGCGIWTGSS